ncbi:MAG: type II toxin-antitoxin system prevent-host-death family antitoxin [Mycobacteriales bacterium]
MARTISQRELRNESGAIMRAVEAGESFIVTRNGVPLAELTPLTRRTFVPREELMRSAASLGRIDAKRFRADVDAILDQSIEPRA